MINKIFLSLLCIITLCPSIKAGNVEEFNFEQSVDQAIDKLEHNNINFVLFTFTDLLGNLHELTVPMSHVRCALLKGLTFDSSSLKGYNNIEDSDMVMKADLSTLRILPWTQGLNKTAWFTCNTYSDFEEPNKLDPRYILQEASKELLDMGLEFFAGPEIEYFVLKNKGVNIEFEDSNKYFDPEYTLNRQQEHQLILASLKELDIDVEKFHHEVASGQYEFSIRYDNAINMADQIVLAKYALQVLYNQLNKKVTFMPKPFSNQNGSGMHINYSLWDKEKNTNAFYGKSDDKFLSSIARNFVAGNIEHMQELGLLFNQTVNSYKRLVPDFEAPVYICWAQKNRSALFRLPSISNPENLRMELRGADVYTNPYLAFAALIKSGIHGLKNKSVLQESISQNLFRLPVRTVNSLNIKKLPRDLEEAINNFDNSNFAKELLTEKGHSILVSLKRKEWNSFKLAVTNWEHDQYL